MVERYLLSDIRMLQEYFKPSRTNDGDCTYVSSDLNDPF